MTDHLARVFISARNANQVAMMRAAGANRSAVMAETVAAVKADPDVRASRVARNEALDALRATGGAVCIHARVCGLEICGDCEPQPGDTIGRPVPWPGPL